MFPKIITRSLALGATLTVLAAAACLMRRSARIDRPAPRRCARAPVRDGDRLRIDEVTAASA